MYEKHFSFKYKPFELVPNPDFLFPSSTHKKAITYLDYGIKEKIGFILLTGEIGSGKTTIVRNFIKNLNGSINLSKVNNTKVSSEQLISMINGDFGLDTVGKSKTRLLGELNEFLIDQYSKKSQPALLIDEAQNLSADLLEEVRLLSNLETDRAKLLQIILVGQPELKKTLMLPELMQLRQRININYHIAPLTVKEVAQYIRHRLTIAGNPDAIILQNDAMNYIYKFSRGIPRLINILCDFALLTAYTEGEKQVSADIIREVAQDLDGRNYWSESQDTNVSMEAKKDQDSDYLKVVGNITFRLVKLEETFEKNLPEIASLSEKIIQLEKVVSKTIDVEEDNKITELIERVSRLERMADFVNAEKALHDLEMSDGNPLAEQMDLLKKTLNNVNSKLKRL
jgi:putative secretion ATPase (PEP-CTERM system associated)